MYSMCANLDGESAIYLAENRLQHLLMQSGFQLICNPSNVLHAGHTTTSDTLGPVLQTSWGVSYASHSIFAPQIAYLLKNFSMLNLQLQRGFVHLLEVVSLRT